MNREQIFNRIPALLVTAIGVAILAAGVGLTVQYTQLQNPRPAIPAASLPTSAPTPHRHCYPAAVGRTVPQHEISIPKNDHSQFSLALQEFAHRQGGCSRFIGNRDHRLTLPQAAIDEILALDRRNYADWAAGATTSEPGAAGTPLRQIDLYADITNHARHEWMLWTGLTTAGFGLLAYVAALLFWTIPAEAETTGNRQPAPVPPGRRAA